VRQHERRTCSVPVEAMVGSSSAGSLTLSRAAMGPSGGVELRIVDFSPGGLGLSGGVYFPRGCCLMVRLAPEEGSEDGHPVEVTVRVRRARMSDRSPSYYLGVSFEADRDQRETFVKALEGRSGVSANAA